MPDAFAQLERQDIDSRIVLDYTSRDFTAIRSQLVGLARGLMPDYETAGEASDFGTLLMEIFAYMGDVMHFYIDRTASEAFLGSAIRQQSVLYIANMLGYTPIGQQSASVTLSFEIDRNATAPVVIPQGTRVHNSTNNADNLIVFETDIEVKLDPTLTPPVLVATGYATEGVVQHDRLLGICSGAPNTEFIIPDKGVVHGSISITSREGGQLVEWTYISNLSLARPTQPLFTVFRDDMDYTHIVFGDNASGRIPPVNAEVFVTYRYGVGAEANLLEPKAIDVLVNDSSSDWWGVTVYNVNSPVGGTDPESADAMRQSIPRAAARIKNRAITLHDYADMALQVPGVAKSVAYGTVYTAVRVKIAPTGGQGTDEYMVELCAEVEDYMADKIIIGSTVYVEPEMMSELWQDVYIRVLVHVQKGYNRTTVRTAVDAVIRQVLSFDNVDFGTMVSIGQIYRAALAVQGVEWAELTWLNTSAPVDTTNPDQGDTEPVIGAAVWQHDNNTTMGDPSTRHYRRNSTTDPTRFAFSVTDDDGRNLSADLLALQVGDHLIYRPVQDVASWMSLSVTAAPTDHTTWVEVAVVKLDAADEINLPKNGDKVMFSGIRYLPTPDSLNGVVDISTDELLIPRIAPFPPIKTGDVLNVSLAADKATVTLKTAHGMAVGETVAVTGVTPSLFNGQYTITTVTPTAVTYDKTGSDIATVDSEGTVTTVNLPESSTDYPGLSEEERTHDGLWVVGEGGLLGS
jgi:nucleotide-binding universal stress UspA family protein